MKLAMSIGIRTVATAGHSRFGIISLVPRLVMLFATAFFAPAAFAATSSTSAEMEMLRVQIEASPTPEAELRYLTLFPKTFDEFTKTFMVLESPNEELEKTSWKHMELLQRLSVKHPRAVLDIWLSNSATAKYDADAVSQLQTQLAAYAATETRTFAAELNAKTNVQRRNIVTFLADVESFSAYPEYSTILSNLKKLGQPQLRRLFLEAKATRQKCRHSSAK